MGALVSRVLSSSLRILKRRTTRKNEPKRLSSQPMPALGGNIMIEQGHASFQSMPALADDSVIGQGHVSSQPIPALVANSVYELYKPAEPKLDVVFFHGLQAINPKDYKNAWRTTWESKIASGASQVETVLWPQQWLQKDFRDARVLSICYDSGATTKGKGETFDALAVVGDQLLKHLDWSEVGHQGRPIFLIGHSLGGLVIKQICVRASILAGVGMDQTGYAARFLHNLKGVFYYATPQAGAKLGDLAGGQLGRLVGATGLVGTDGDAFKYLKVLSPFTAELNDKFSNLRKSEADKGRRWKTAAVAEDRVTQYGPFSFMVVTEAAIKFDLDYELTMAVGKDHFTVCQPAGPTDVSYLALRDFLRQEYSKAQAPSAPPMLSRAPQSQPAPAANAMFVCPITQQVMTNPVMAADGHTYERAAIEEWLKLRQTSPMTNEALPSTSLTPNHALRSAIMEARQQGRL